MDQIARGRGDRGQVGIGLALLVAGCATLTMMLTASLGRTVIDRTRARTAADAAALAGVTGGRPAAEAVAAGNGGELEALAEIGPVVEARVRVGTARATSRAAASTGSPPARQSDRVSTSNAGL
jgi:hypothetical protein